MQQTVQDRASRDADDVALDTHLGPLWLVLEQADPSRTSRGPNTAAILRALRPPENPLGRFQAPSVFAEIRGVEKVADLLRHNRLTQSQPSRRPPPSNRDRIRSPECPRESCLLDPWIPLSWDLDSLDRDSLLELGNTNWNRRIVIRV